VKYPLKDDKGKWIIKNFFMMDIQDLILVFVIVFMIWGYKHDTAQCFEVLEKPCDYAERIGCNQPVYGRVNSTVYNNIGVGINFSGGALLEKGMST